MMSIEVLHTTFIWFINSLFNLNGDVIERFITANRQS